MYPATQPTQQPRHQTTQVPSKATPSQQLHPASHLDSAQPSSRPATQATQPPGSIQHRHMMQPDFELSGEVLPKIESLVFMLWDWKRATFYGSGVLGCLIVGWQNCSIFVLYLALTFIIVLSQLFKGLPTLYNLPAHQSLSDQVHF